MKKILNVRKVAFHGKTGDNRSPESFPFPACMASLTEALGVPDPIETIHAHGTTYEKRTANDAYLAASGMAFALLWHREYCPSALDVMQAVGHETCIRRAFAWAGYDYALFERTGDNAEAAKKAVFAAIDRGAPVLAFGVIDPPECALIAGYDGDALLGWSHFGEELPHEENGMFRAENWQNDWWLFAVPGEKTARSLTYADVKSFGLSVMEKTEADGYIAGLAAYDEWLRVLEDLADDGTEAFFNFHHMLLFSLAELRAWGANFLREAGAPDAAQCFSDIHDLCWKADAVTKNGGAASLKAPETRAALAAVIREIRAKDVQAMGYLR